MATSSVIYVTAQLGSDLPGTEASAPSARVRPIHVNTSKPGLMIGVLLAVVGNLVISIGLNVQKYVHNRNEARPESERRPFTAQPVWWLGLGCTVAGELGNFLAFGFAGADIVTPLGAVAVVSNAVIACTLLGELFRIRDALGVLLTCLGGTLIVVKAPASDESMSVTDLIAYATNPIFVGYISAVLVTLLVLRAQLPRVQHKHPVFGLLLCSLLGTLTVLCATALSHFLVSASVGAALRSWVPYALLCVLVPTAVGQVKYLNETMELFDNTQVVPIYYILFTLSTITGSAMLYQDFYEQPAGAVVVFVLGCLLCFTGVGLLTSGRIASDEAPSPRALSEEALAHELPAAPPARVDAAAAAAAAKPSPAARSRRSQPQRSAVRAALRHLDDPLLLPRRPQSFSRRLDGARGVVQPVLASPATIAHSLDELYPRTAAFADARAPGAFRAGSGPTTRGPPSLSRSGSAPVMLRTVRRAPVAPHGMMWSITASRERLEPARPPAGPYAQPGPSRSASRPPQHRRSQSDGSGRNQAGFEAASSDHDAEWPGEQRRSGGGGLGARARLPQPGA